MLHCVTVTTGWSLPGCAPTACWSASATSVRARLSATFSSFPDGSLILFKEIAFNAFYGEPVHGVVLSEGRLS